MGEAGRSGRKCAESGEATRVTEKNCITTPEQHTTLSLGVARARGRMRAKRSMCSGGGREPVAEEIVYCRGYKVQRVQSGRCKLWA